MTGISKFDSVVAAQRANDKKNRSREAQASIYPNDKLRVLPTRHQTARTPRGQVVTFRPTHVVEDPLIIQLMDELDIDYTVVSEPIEELDARCNWNKCRRNRETDGPFCIPHVKHVREALGLDEAPTADDGASAGVENEGLPPAVPPRVVYDGSPMISNEESGWEPKE